MAIIANVVGSEVWEQQLKNKKFTVYKIIVQYGQQSWTFYRRYNEFSTLCDSVRMSFFFCYFFIFNSNSIIFKFDHVIQLKKQYPYLHLKLPGKKLFGNNFSTDFIKNRRQGLDTLVQRIFAERQLLDQ